MSSTPARMIDPAVGASTCASGSHVWKGNMGTLIANAAANARNTQFCMPTGSLGPFAISSSMSSVLGVWARYSTIIATSIKSDPASVYRKNLTAAYTRLDDPQMPISRAMGTSMTSQKM